MASSREEKREYREPESVDVLVIGMGFAGMYILYSLRQRGLTAWAFEAGSDVGGTWYWNRYPGARVDVDSVQYSYNFSDELTQEWEWTEKFAAQPELLVTPPTSPTDSTCAATPSSTPGSSLRSSTMTRTYGP